jgi:hypothetical protein
MITKNGVVVSKKIKIVSKEELKKIVKQMEDHIDAINNDKEQVENEIKALDYIKIKKLLKDTKWNVIFEYTTDSQIYMTPEYPNTNMDDICNILRAWWGSLYPIDKIQIHEHDNELSITIYDWNVFYKFIEETGMIINNTYIDNNIEKAKDKLNKLIEFKNKINIKKI